MVWEQQSATIVMLAKEREAGRAKSHKYWPQPEGGAITYASFQVISRGENAYGDYVLRDITLVDTRVSSNSSLLSVPSLVPRPSLSFF